MAAKRIILSAILTACCWLGAIQPAISQSYPAHPVRIIVPAEPAGGTDAIARVIAQELTKSLGQTFYVDNRPGGGQVIGIEAAALARADGYTLLMAASPIVISPATKKNIRFDPMRDFTPITQAITAQAVLVVSPSLPVRTLADFIALAKQQPGQLNYASAGIGSQPHMAMELFKNMTGISIQDIPYKSVAPGLTDVIAGRVSGMFVNVLTAKPHIDAGTLRALGVSGAKRISAMPDAPTIAEAGITNYEAVQWFGLFAPAGTPPDIIELVYREAAKALKAPRMKDILVAEGAEPVGSSPAEFAKFVKSELEKWAKVAKASGIEPR